MTDTTLEKFAATIAELDADLDMGILLPQLLGLVKEVRDICKDGRVTVAEGIRFGAKVFTLVKSVIRAK